MVVGDAAPASLTPDRADDLFAEHARSRRRPEQDGGLDLSHDFAEWYRSIPGEAVARQIRSPHCELTFVLLFDDSAFVEQAVAIDEDLG